MLGGNTAWLIRTQRRSPSDDPAFRRALAEAVTQDVVVRLRNIVAASTRLASCLCGASTLDAAQVKSLGATFNLAKAKADLAAAGYKAGSDGKVPTDGSAIKLKPRSPGWLSDWWKREC